MELKNIMLSYLSANNTHIIHQMSHDIFLHIFVAADPKMALPSFIKLKYPNSYFL